MNYKIILLLLFLAPIVTPVTASRDGFVHSTHVQESTELAPDPEGSCLTDACTCFGLGFVGACGLNFAGRALVDTFKAAEQPWTIITSIFAAGGLALKWWHDRISARRMLVKFAATTAGILAGSYFGNVGYEFVCNWLKRQGSHPVAPAVASVARPVAQRAQRAQQFDPAALAATVTRQQAQQAKHVEQERLLRIGREDDTVSEEAQKPKSFWDMLN